jgi:hypothetical protein
MSSLHVCLDFARHWSLAYHPLQCSLVLYEGFVIVRSLGMVVKSTLQPELFS